jgi:apolipoprotein N-acyltransferase
VTRATRAGPGRTSDAPSLTWTTTVAAGLASGALLSLGVRLPLGPWLHVIAFLPLLWCLDRRPSARRALLCGALTGLGVAAPAFEGLLLAAPVAYPAALLGSALVFGLAMTATAWIRAALGRAAMLAMWPALWLAAEWLPSLRLLWGDLAVPIARVAYAHADTPLLRLAPWSGPGAATLAVLLIGLALHLLVRDGRARPVRSAGLATLSLTPVLLGVALAPTPTPAAGVEARSVVAVQASVPTVDTIAGRFDDEVARRLLELHVALSRRAQERDPDLIVWAETVLPRPIDPTSPPSEVSAALDRAFGATPHALVGAITERPGGRHNAVLVWREGSLAEVYRKRTLLPWIETSDYRRGPPVPPVALGDAAVGTAVCLDVAFPGVVRDAVRAGAQLLVLVTNDDFAIGTVTPALHLAVARFRAAETGRPLLFAGQSGPTAFVDARGRVVASLDPTERAALAGTLRPHAGATPFLRLGDWVSALGTAFAGFSTALALAALGADRLRRRRHGRG